MQARNLIIGFVMLGALLVIAGAYMKIIQMPASDFVITTGFVMDAIALAIGILQRKKA